MNEGSSILFLGDVVPHKPYRFKNTYKTIFNLECPITRVGKPVQGKVILSVEENYLHNIFGSALFCANLGNNHILDFGKEGLDSTLTALEVLKIKWFGITPPTDDEYNSLVIELNKLKIALISVVCPSTSPVAGMNEVGHLALLDEDRIIDKISKLKDSVHRIIIFIHWGIEESSLPAQKDILLARRLIDAGADVIIGSHAHATQPIEKYKGGIIAYNLGNFIMPPLKQIPSYYNEDGLPQSLYTKRLMIWNRVSWGLIINLENLTFHIKKFVFIFNRIIELPVTRWDKYLKLHYTDNYKSYEQEIRKHLKKREFARKVAGFLTNPYIPERIKKII